MNVAITLDTGAWAEVTSYLEAIAVRLDNESRETDPIGRSALRQDAAAARYHAARIRHMVLTHAVQS